MNLEYYPTFVAHLNAGSSKEIKDRISKKTNLLHAAIGINTENGEIQDQLKKHLFYGKELDTVNLKEELGDLLWYVQLMCNELQCTIEEVVTLNMNKLRKRYKENWTAKEALNRDLKGERLELEGGGE